MYRIIINMLIRMLSDLRNTIAKLNIGSIYGVLTLFHILFKASSRDLYI